MQGSRQLSLCRTRFPAGPGNAAPHRHAHRENERPLSLATDAGARALAAIPCFDPLNSPTRCAMAFSLYAATVPSFQQTLGAVSGLLNKAEDFCAEKGSAAQELIQARFAADMFPFAY